MLPVTCSNRSIQPTSTPGNHIPNGQDQELKTHLAVQPTVVGAGKPGRCAEGKDAQSPGAASPPCYWAGALRWVSPGRGDRGLEKGLGRLGEAGGGGGDLPLLSTPGHLPSCLGGGSSRRQAGLSRLLVLGTEDETPQVWELGPCPSTDPVAAVSAGACGSLHSPPTGQPALFSECGQLCDISSVL